jgi:hypothetical protein
MAVSGQMMSNSNERIASQPEQISSLDFDFFYVEQTPKYAFDTLNAEISDDDRRVFGIDTLQFIDEFLKNKIVNIVVSTVKDSWQATGFFAAYDWDKKNNDSFFQRTKKKNIKSLCFNWEDERIEFVSQKEGNIYHLQVLKGSQKELYYEAYVLHNIIPLHPKNKIYDSVGKKALARICLLHNFSKVKEIKYKNIIDFILKVKKGTSIIYGCRLFFLRSQRKERALVAIIEQLKTANQVLPIEEILRRVISNALVVRGGQKKEENKENEMSAARENGLLDNGKANGMQETTSGQAILDLLQEEEFKEINQLLKNAMQIKDRKIIYADLQRFADPLTSTGSVAINDDRTVCSPYYTSIKRSS